jgi:hypothetical protein
LQAVRTVAVLAIAVLTVSLTSTSILVVAVLTVSLLAIAVLVVAVLGIVTLSVLTVAVLVVTGVTVLVVAVLTFSFTVLAVAVLALTILLLAVLVLAVLIFTGLLVHLYLVSDIEVAYLSVHDYRIDGVFGRIEDVCETRLGERYPAFGSVLFFTDLQPDRVHISFQRDVVARFLVSDVFYFCDRFVLLECSCVSDGISVGSNTGECVFAPVVSGIEIFRRVREFLYPDTDTLCVRSCVYHSNSGSARGLLGEQVLLFSSSNFRAQEPSSSDSSCALDKPTSSDVWFDHACRKKGSLDIVRGTPLLTGVNLFVWSG